jgi:hypothetical protein
MKKLLFSMAFLACLFATNLASASNYKVDEATVDQLFSASDDVTFTASEEAYAMMNPSSQAVTKGGKTVGGYLIRAFFLRWFCFTSFLHGYRWQIIILALLLYSWWFGVITTVDFWWVLFKGSDAMNKYSDNSKWVVWAGN